MSTGTVGIITGDSARQGAQPEWEVVGMVLPWFIVWLAEGAPALHEWNGWLVSLIVCAVLL